MEIINESNIFDLLNKYKDPDSKLVDEVISEARKIKSLTLEQAAVLININKPEDYEKLFDAASYIKETIYGKRIVLFAPLYLSNYCTNNCLYCGFRVGNKTLHRSTLTKEEIEREVKILLDQGHKRVLLLTGEHPKEASLERLIEDINTVYSVRNEKGSYIRRINI